MNKTSVSNSIPYPLSLILYPLSLPLVPYPLFPCTVPFEKIEVGDVLVIVVIPRKSKLVLDLRLEFSKTTLSWDCHTPRFKFS